MKPKPIHYSVFIALILTILINGCSVQGNPVPTPTATTTPSCSEYENLTEIETVEDLILGIYEVWNYLADDELSLIGYLCIYPDGYFSYENITNSEEPLSVDEEKETIFSASGNYVIDLEDDLTMDTRLEEISSDYFYLGRIYIGKNPGLFIRYSREIPEIGFDPTWSVLFYPQIFKTISN